MGHSSSFQNFKKLCFVRILSLQDVLEQNQLQKPEKTDQVGSNFEFLLATYGI
jgi:hypothetical protein